MSAAISRCVLPVARSKDPIAEAWRAAVAVS
jgi:hypothetical protein